MEAQITRHLVRPAQVIPVGVAGAEVPGGVVRVTGVRNLLPMAIPTRQDMTTVLRVVETDIVQHPGSRLRVLALSSPSAVVTEDEALVVQGSGLAWLLED